MIDNFFFNNLTIYRSIYDYINSNMYVIIENKSALIVDPHENENIFKKLKEVKDITIILTHEHPDHISGIYWLQKNFKTTLICSKNCAKYISDRKSVRPILIRFVLDEQDRKNGTKLLDKFNRDFVLHTYKANNIFKKEYLLKWSSHNLAFYTISGHSEGSCIIILDDKIVFSGDSLLKELPVITRFPGGNKLKYKEESLSFLEKILSSKMQILPGHGNPFILEEIMKDGKINVEFK